MSNSESKGSVIRQLFQALKPHQSNQGGGTGISEVQALSSENMSNLIYSSSKTKKDLYQEYREMALFPEVADAIDEIKSEAIIQDNDGKLINLNILDPDLNSNENVVSNLQKEFDYVINKVLDFNSNAQDLFGKYYVEGELYAELMIDKDNKAAGLKGIKYLPSYTMNIEYGDNQEPLKYIQDLKGMNLSLKQRAETEITRKLEIEFEPTQIAYINSGMVDFKKNLVYSFLERAKVAYKQLKWMENALIVYRITRAPERRVFYIDVGKLPKQSADEYVNSLITKFKNKKIYNPTTGDIDVGRDTMSMEEDFFFPQRSGGEGSKVDVLPGGTGLGELSDVEYFLRKLYKALKVPQVRMTDPTSLYTPGRTAEITREEVKFSKYIQSIKSRFLDFIYQIFFTHLQLKGLYSQYNLDKTKIAITFIDNNSWKELKDLEMKRARIDIFKDQMEYADIFPIKYLLKETLKLSDSEISDIDDLMKEQGVSSSGKGSEEETPEEDANLTAKATVITPELLNGYTSRKDIL